MAKKSKAKRNAVERGRSLLQSIYTEHTGEMSKADMYPDEWANNPARFADEALKRLAAGDADGAVYWAIVAAIRSSGSRFLARHRALFQVVQQKDKLAIWRDEQARDKQAAADRYREYLVLNPSAKKATALTHAVKGTSIKPRTLRDFLAN